MTEIDHARWADEMLYPVLRAGAAIMAHRERGFAVEAKADDSPVTAADREAEDIILAALARIAPGVAVVAEEASSKGAPPVSADSFFLVDPLDGTREFVSGGTDFTINIGFIVDRLPRFGLIYAPAAGRLFMTLADDRLAESSAAPTLQPRRLADLSLSEIRTRQPDLRSLTAVASRSHLTPETARFLDRPNITGCRNIGSSLKFCLVARGEADVYPRFGPTSEWDTAAGHAILLAAGGEVTTLDGGPFQYGKAETRYINPGFVAWGRKSLLPSFIG